MNHTITADYNQNQKDSGRPGDKLGVSMFKFARNKFESPLSIV